MKTNLRWNFFWNNGTELLQAKTEVDKKYKKTEEVRLTRLIWLWIFLSYSVDSSRQQLQTVSFWGYYTFHTVTVHWFVLVKAAKGIATKDWLLYQTTKIVSMNHCSLITIGRVWTRGGLEIILQKYTNPNASLKSDPNRSKIY